MKVEQLLGQFEIITDAEDGVQKFKEYIINLGIRGQLTKQSDDDLPVGKILERINKQKETLYKEKKIPKPKYAELDPNIITPFEIPDTWRWHSLDEISVYIQRGKSPKYSEEDKIPVVSQKCIQWEGFDFSRVRFIDPETLNKYQVYRFLRKSDLLWNSTGTGTIGRINLYDDSNDYNKVVADSHVTIVRTGNAINEKYIMYWIASGLVQNDFEEIASGTTKQKELNTSTAKAFPVPVPPLEEQQRIVQKIETLFSQVDELEQKVQQDQEVDERLQVAVLDDLQRAETPEASRQSWQRLTDHFEQIYRKPEHIEQLKQAILNEAVRGRLVPQDPNDEPAAQLLERIKEEKQQLYDEGEIRKPKDLDPVRDDEMLYELPNQWCWTRIGTACSISGGKRVPKGYSLQDEPTPYIYVRVTDMKEGTVLDGDLKYISEEVKSQISKYTISKNDLYITIAGTIGDVGSIPEKFDGMNLTENAAKIQLYLLNKNYLQKVLNSPVVQTQFFQKVNKMAQPKLALKRIRSTIFPMPPLEEQERIIDKVEELFTWCDDLKEKLSRSQQTDQRLLEALVNGEKK